MHNLRGLPAYIPDHWDVVPGDARRGNQGAITRLRHKITGQSAALKVLHDQHLEARERRVRMLQEVHALQILDGNGTPRVLATNVHTAWEEKSTPLFLIMEWITGPSLEEYMAGKALPPGEAIRIAAALARHIARYHDEGICHRDVKTDHIVLRNGDPTDPVLVDFGMAWSRPSDEVEDVGTANQQEIGNRFFRLPEHAAGSFNKRDARSDVTMLVGVLFYMVTGRAPRHLVDENGTPPHERSNAVPDSLKAHPEWPLLRRIFHLGFQQQISARFQSAEEFLEILNQQTRSEAGSPPNVEPLLEILESAEHERRMYTHARMAGMGQLFWDLTLRALGPRVGSKISSSATDPVVRDGRYASMKCVISLNDGSGPDASLDHVVDLLEDGRIRAGYGVEGARHVHYFIGRPRDESGQDEAIKQAAFDVAQALADTLTLKLREPRQSA